MAWAFLLDGSALRQHRLENADQEERRKQIAVVEMSEQVGVVGTVSRQDFAARATAASAWRTSRNAAALSWSLCSPAASASSSACQGAGSPSSARKA